MATIRRISDTSTTCLPKSLGPRNLCSSCGKRDQCPVGLQLDKHVTTCDEYQWSLKFRDQTGLERGICNTLRLGKAWSERLRDGDVVLLVDKDERPLHRARVLGIQVGPRDDIIRTHAWSNHLLINRVRAGEMTVAEAGEWLLEKMPSLYGGLIFRNNDLCTVIGLERID